MTRKDEELLVGSILQKIIVPHPAVSGLEAIEVGMHLWHINIFLKSVESIVTYVIEQSNTMIRI